MRISVWYSNTMKRMTLFYKCYSACKMYLERTLTFSLKLHSVRKRIGLWNKKQYIYANFCDQSKQDKCSLSSTSGCVLTLMCLHLQQQLAQLQKEKSEILKNLALYYFTFVDVMEFKVGKHTCIDTHTTIFVHRGERVHLCENRTMCVSCWTPLTPARFSSTLWALHSIPLQPGTFCRSCSLSPCVPVRRWTLTSPRTTWTWWWPTRPWWPSCHASRRGRPSSACTTTPTRWRTEPGEPRRPSTRFPVLNPCVDQVLMLFLWLCSDREYPRLGQMIVDYENPLKKMMEEFVPHGKVEKHFVMFTDTLAHLSKWLRRLWLISLYF